MLLVAEVSREALMKGYRVLMSSSPSLPVKEDILLWWGVACVGWLVVCPFVYTTQAAPRAGDGVIMATFAFAVVSAVLFPYAILRFTQDTTICENVPGDAALLCRPPGLLFLSVSGMVTAAFLNWHIIVCQRLGV